MKVAKQNRQTIKGSLTRFITYFNSFLSSEPDPIQISELKIRLDAAEKLLDCFNDAQSQYKVADPDYDINIETTHLVERESFENKYYSIIAEVKQFISDFL